MQENTNTTAMASSPIKLVSFLLPCIFFLLSELSYYADSNPGQASSLASVLNQIEGCHKGETVKGLSQVKAYFEQYGYLEKNAAGGDLFDDSLESAVKTYQHNYNLEPTGELDGETVAKIAEPRCGVPDVVNGTNRMRRLLDNGPYSFHTSLHYAFFPGNPKWPRYQLSYGFRSDTPNYAINPVAQAFSSWAQVSPFRFTYTQNYASADLKISFDRGNHGDGYPFDGRGGTLAHAFAPTDGRFHYDADDRFAVGPVNGAFDLETVARHEIGHLLGLHHSADVNAIMYATIQAGTTKSLNADDVQGLRVLYRY